MPTYRKPTTKLPANSLPEQANDRSSVGWIVGIVLVTFLLYARVIGYDFVNFDDDAHVYENPDVRAGLSWSSVQWAFGIHGPSQWHPLAWLSHQLDWQLFGGAAAGHHFTNLLFHLGGVVMVYLALNELLGRPRAAALVAAMFALHPLNVESVAWVSERRNVLCGLFAMLSVWLYARYARSPSLARYTAVTVSFSLALMAKPMAVTLPCVFALLDYWPLRRCPLSENWQPLAGGCLREPCSPRPWSMLLGEKVPWLLLAGGASWLSYECQASIQVVSSFSDLPLGLRLENALAAYGLYLRRVLLPVDLAVFYPHPAWFKSDPQEQLFWPALMGGVALLLVTGLVMWRLRRDPGCAIGWFIFLGTLVPMIGLVQVGQQQLADRYVYVALVGLGLLAVSVPVPEKRQWLARGIAWGTLALWAVIAVEQIGYWENSRTLFQRAVAVTKNNSWAHHNLALAYRNEGDQVQAIEHLQEALAIDPRYELAHYNLGISWQDAGRLDEAIRQYETALQIDQNHVDAWIRLGTAFGESGRFDRAEDCFRQALSLNPRAAQAMFNLGIVLDARQATEESLAQLENAVQLAPESVEFRTGWMLALVKAGRRSEARLQAEQILQLDPTAIAARQVLSAGE